MEEMTKLDCEQIRRKKDNHEVLMVINHSNILRYLQYLSISGRKKLSAKAYLWHYKYADLEAAF